MLSDFMILNLVAIRKGIIVVLGTCGDGLKFFPGPFWLVEAFLSDLVATYLIALQAHTYRSIKTMFCICLFKA